MPFACLLVASFLVPQGEARLAGRVLGSDARPAAAAEVTLLHRPISRHFDSTAEHRLVVQTDANGAFRAALRDGLVYSAWSRSAAAASRIAEGVTAGDFLELREVEGTAPMTVKVEGLDAWEQAATFGFRVLVGSEHLDFVPLQRNGSELLVPALPPMRHRPIEVLQAGGEVLWAEHIAFRPEGALLSVPPPAEYTVRVADDAGAPLPGVEIRAHIVNYWGTQSEGVFSSDRFRALWPVRGQTDGEGRLRLRLPQPATKRDLLLLARKDGYGMSFDGLLDGRKFRAGTVLPGDPAAGTERTLAIELRKQEPVKVPLLAAGGTAYGVQSLFVVARVTVTKEDGGGTGLPLQLHLPVADGIAVLGSPLPPGTVIELAWTHLAPAIATDLQRQHGVQPPVEFRLPAAKQLLAKGAPVQLDPQRYHLLQVIAADGRPAAHTVVQLREDLTKHGRLVRTDRLGRVLFELHGKTRASVFARDGIGGIHIADDAKGPTRLVLHALRSVTGRIVDREGKPVAGVGVAASIKGEEGGELLANEHRELSFMLPLDPSNRDGAFTMLLPAFLAEAGLDISGEGVIVVDGENFTWDPAAPPVIEVTVTRQ